jgi:hypothetical protein
MVHETKPESEFLSDAEKRDLTGFSRGAEQSRWLDTQGVPHRLVGRRVIVSRVHVRKRLLGELVPASEGPNWDVPFMRAPDLSKVR